MHLFDLLTRAEHALMPPKVLEIVAAYPLARLLIFICKGSLEAVLLWQMLLEFVPGHQGITKHLEFVLLRLKEVL